MCPRESKLYFVSCPTPNSELWLYSSIPPENLRVCPYTYIYIVMFIALASGNVSKQVVYPCAHSCASTKYQALVPHDVDRMANNDHHAPMCIQEVKTFRWASKGLDRSHRSFGTSRVTGRSTLPRPPVRRNEDAATLPCTTRPPVLHLA